MELNGIRLLIYLLMYDLVHAFISSRLDYCNQLFVGVTGRLLDKLPSPQNAAARLVTGARKFDHITPVMWELHWLPVRQRIRLPSWIGSGISVWVLQVDDRPFTSAISQCVPTVCSAQTDNLRRQEFCRQWTGRVEQFTCGTAIKWRHWGDFQKTAEDISV